ncbi:MAG: glycosyltransferase family 4 protein, partial [Actinomycetota bacterium]|nr:glycosyltransferase family 4 protein [Actinomycetota bacterium]
DGRSRLRRVAAESGWLARRTTGAALVHHAGGTAPMRRSAPYVLTVHDVQPLERTASHSALKRAYLARVIPPSVERAERVIVPSQFVATTLRQHTAVDPARVTVVPHGVDVHPAPTPAAELRARYDLRDPVVYYPAITYPHKDHATLVEAFTQVVRHHPDATLVLSGGQGSSEAELAAQIDRAGLRARVRRVGRVPAADVAGLYRAAAVVAIPSTYEGFGLPAVEAMAYGAPVVAAATTALPEVVGDAGVLVPAREPDAWARALVDLLGDDARRVALAAAGAERAQRFSWTANAGALLDVYLGALGP